MPHTPGPFTILFNNKKQIHCAEIFDASGPMHGMHIGSASWTRTPGEGHANADLFRAAPDLLAACKRLATAAANRENTMGDPCRLIECQSELLYATAEARAAISKAEGKV